MKIGALDKNFGNIYIIKMRKYTIKLQAYLKIK